MENKFQAIAPISPNAVEQNRAPVQTPRQRKITIRVTESEASALNEWAQGKKLSEYIRGILFDSRKKRSPELPQINRDAYLLLLEMNERLMEIQEAVTLDETGDTSETNEQLSALMEWTKQIQIQLVSPAVTQAKGEQAFTPQGELLRNAPTLERNAELEQLLEVYWQ